MALQFTGGDIALVRNESTGKFDHVWSSAGPNAGNPVLDNTRSHAVLTTLVSRKRGTRPGSQTPEGGYYYDPQNRRGTLLWTRRRIGYLRRQWRSRSRKMAGSSC